MHAIAMHGQAELPRNFGNFPYVNPQAPKGGRLTIGRVGSFNSFNPYSLKGLPARGLDLVFEPLMARSRDEAFTLYSLIAQSVEVPDDRSWVAFTLNPGARFQDGRPITVEDVAFSLEVLRAKGRPNQRAYYRNVARIEIPRSNTIRFVFKPGDNWELPLILALMVVLPKHRYSDGRIERADLTLPLGSGPYRLAAFDAARRVVYRRDPNYWAKDLPVNVGRFNFDEIRYDYYRDRSVALEAFKKGLIDIWFESDPATWRRELDLTDQGEGRWRRLEIPHGRAEGMHAFVFNTRRAIFADQRVRRALIHAFDFEWINRAYYFDGYERAVSFFNNTELAASGPAGPEEKALLSAFPGSVDAAFLDAGYQPPQSDGSGNNRGNLRQALKLFKAAGWQLDGKRLVRRKDGRPFEFELLVQRQEDLRLGSAFRRWLERLGIEISLRLVDSAQYRQRLNNYDYDMIVHRWGASLSPGNEQRFYWGSAGVTQPGTRNYAGIDDPAVDGLVDRIVAARSRQSLKAATRALDRVLLSGYYGIPLFTSPMDRVAHWSRVAPPARPALFGTDIVEWWARDADR